tara:strand:- start:113 stop:337 length:225 start_codon:yes stop_codon:yes gene_type:complete
MISQVIFGTFGSVIGLSVFYYGMVKFGYYVCKKSQIKRMTKMVHKLEEHQDDNTKLIEEIHSYIFKLSHNIKNE